MGISHQVFFCPVTTTRNTIFKMAKLLIALTLLAMVAGTFALSCSTCETDIIADVKICKEAADTKAIVTCVMDAMKTSVDCIECVCSIVADVFQLDASICQ